MAALRAVLSLAVVTLLAAPAPAQELLSDAKLGIKLKAPDGYTRVPLKPDEEWIAARWISPRSYYQNDKSGFSIDHKPELTVISFPSDKVKQRVEEQKSGTGEQSRTITIIKNPFKDYRDYLKRTYNEGGFFIAKEDKASRGRPRNFVFRFQPGEKSFSLAMQFRKAHVSREEIIQALEATLEGLKKS